MQSNKTKHDETLFILSLRCVPWKQFEKIRLVSNDIYIQQFFHVKNFSLTSVHSFYLNNTNFKLNFVSISMLPNILLMKLIQYIATYSVYGNSHDDVIKWKHFPRYWQFARGIHRLPVTAQRPVTRSFDVLFDLHLNKRLSKQSWSC